MKKYLVKQKEKVALSDWKPDDTSEFEGTKKDGLAALQKLSKRLDQLQELLYAEHAHKVLVVIQAMDTGGKDGTIRSVFDGVNPQGVRVASFKVPTPEEMDHDYLWRIHKQMPGRGEIVIFNRSHYEDLLIVRVHKLVPRKVWEKRFQHINEFERMLKDEGTTIIKFFLNIDLDEQKARLLDRINTPEKNWKFNPGDLDERKLWKNYMEAYEDVLSKTSKPWAPWYIIPSNRNWYRNLAVSTILVDTLEKLKMKYPQPVENIQQYAIELDPDAVEKPVADKPLIVSPQAEGQ
jgi:PPK2 family polyphosphate:nucleotide phosphotransferase